ncbi:unnamed protein product, partial [marine sediment metagenome]
ITAAVQTKVKEGKEKYAQKVFKIIVDERSNSLIVIASAEDMNRVKGLIEKLDKDIETKAGDIHVYYLENADATNLAAILKQIYESKVKPPKRGAAVGKEVKPAIVADKTTNSLIITASPEDYEMFAEMIKKLDIMRDQVLVEMLIAEVSLGRTSELGIELAMLEEPVEGKERPFGVTDFTSAIQNMATGKVPGLSGMVVGLMKGTTAAGTPKVGALIQAYQKDSNFNILSAPHILTSDHEEAKIMIGENIPYVKDFRVTEIDT